MQGGTLYGLLSVIKTTLNYIIPILVSIAVVYFIWGVISHVISQNDEERKKSADHIINGIIGLFIIVAIWGILTFVSTTLGVDIQDQSFNQLPQLK